MRAAAARGTTRVAPKAIAGLFSLFLACTVGDPTLAPPEVAWGEEECARCRMIVSEERHAAAVWTPEGESRAFDDPGDLVAWLAETGEEPRSAWVHDHASGGWIRAETAWYVRADAGATPMGSGLLPFADRGAAEARAGGRPVVGWTELRAAAGPETTAGGV